MSDFEDVSAIEVLHPPTDGTPNETCIVAASPCTSADNRRCQSGSDPAAQHPDGSQHRTGTQSDDELSCDGPRPPLAHELVEDLGQLRERLQAQLDAVMTLRSGADNTIRLCQLCQHASQPWVTHLRQASRAANSALICLRRAIRQRPICASLRRDEESEELDSDIEEDDDESSRMESENVRATGSRAAVSQSDGSERAGLKALRALSKGALAQRALTKGALTKGALPGGPHTGRPLPVEVLSETASECGVPNRPSSVADVENCQVLRQSVTTGVLPQTRPEEGYSSEPHQPSTAVLSGPPVAPTKRRRKMGISEHSETKIAAQAPAPQPNCQPGQPGEPGQLDQPEGHLEGHSEGHSEGRRGVTTRAQGRSGVMGATGGAVSVSFGKKSGVSRFLEPPKSPRKVDWEDESPPLEEVRRVFAMVTGRPAEVATTVLPTPSTEGAPEDQRPRLPGSLAGDDEPALPAPRHSERDRVRRGASTKTRKRWRPEETDAFLRALNIVGPGQWSRMRVYMQRWPDRDGVQLKDKYRNLCVRGKLGMNENNQYYLWQPGDPLYQRIESDVVTGRRLEG